MMIIGKFSLACKRHQKSTFSGIGSHYDSISWLKELEDLGDLTKDTKLAFWIHTHVRGSLCGFSSVDVHTQYAYNLLSPKVLGLVIQLNENGECENYDFYELTSTGSKIVKECGKTLNLSSIQHESCSGQDLFKSAKQKIEFSEKISINVQDYRISTEEKFAFDFCKSCQKEFKNVLLHLSRIEKCRKIYGTTYEKMKQFKSDEKKRYIKDYYQKNIATIKK